MNLKKKYNEWLFEKYGFDTGEEFEKIPLRYTASPLFSPSLYGMVAMKRMANSFICGFEQWINSSRRREE
jgi:hypothetical protein